MWCTYTEARFSLVHKHWTLAVAALPVWHQICPLRPDGPLQKIDALHSLQSQRTQFLACAKRATQNLLTHKINLKLGWGTQRRVVFGKGILILFPSLPPALKCCVFFQFWPYNWMSGFVLFSKSFYCKLPDASFNLSWIARSQRFFLNKMWITVRVIRSIRQAKISSPASTEWRMQCGTIIAALKTGGGPTSWDTISCLVLCLSFL